VVELLLKTDGVDVNKGDEAGETPLLIAAEKGHSSVVELVLKADGVDVNKGNNDGYTPLHVAAQNGHLSVVELLLKADGVDVRKKNVLGRTPLRLAFGRGHASVVHLFLAESYEGDVPVQVRLRLIKYSRAVGDLYLYWVSVGELILIIPSACVNMLLDQIYALALNEKNIISGFISLAFDTILILILFLPVVVLLRVRLIHLVMSVLCLVSLLRLFLR